MLLFSWGAESRGFRRKMQVNAGDLSGSNAGLRRSPLTPCFSAFYTAFMNRCWPPVSHSRWSLAGWIVLLVVALGACSSKAPPYPEDHARIQRIDQAVDALRNAYQTKDRSSFKSLLLQEEALDVLQRNAEADFDAFHSISLEFKIERIMIEGDTIDVHVRWQGLWKNTAEESGVRQRGHARFQWSGTGTILLRAAQGDLPFGMKAKQALSESLPSPPDLQ
jgi:hypothetical protein